MKIQTVIETLEHLAPLDFASDWDNVGLLLDSLETNEINTILLTIDLTETVANEAIEKGVDFIITYHPILFAPIQRLRNSSPADRTIMKLIKNNIAVYAPHTALDAVKGGVNDWLSGAFLSSSSTEFLHPSDSEDAGDGRLVTLDEPLPFETLVAQVKAFLNLEKVRIAKPLDECDIQTIALCAGAGSSVISGTKADCYLTGEMSHHQILEATQGGKFVILCEHTNTERGFLETFKQNLEESWNEDVNILISDVDIDPIKIK